MDGKREETERDVGAMRRREAGEKCMRDIKFFNEFLVPF